MRPRPRRWALYSDEDFPRRTVEMLRQMGHHVLTALEAGKANSRLPDEEQLRYATQQGRAVLTINRHDFFRLHRLIDSPQGIIACTYDPDVIALGGRIHEAILKNEPLAGKLVRVVQPNPQKRRARA